MRFGILALALLAACGPDVVDAVADADDTPMGRVSWYPDVDGDGLGELFVGAYYQSGGPSYLFPGSAF
jgi:hypothetical protein